MNKLNKAFVINPLYEADGYKVAHKNMLAPNTKREAWTWIPRSLKHMHPSITKIMSGGQQVTWRYIHSNFKEHFFDKSVDEALRFGADMATYLGTTYDSDHFTALHELQYLPIKIQSLDEGVFTNPNIPHMTGINTVDGYAWLGLFLETLVSKLSWQLPIAATIGAKFKQNAKEWVMKTDSENIALSDFMCHDFHSRGGNPFTSIAVGLGHSFSNLGSDTLNVIPASRYYYDFSKTDVPIYSVNASEHSVTCTGIFYYDNILRTTDQGLEYIKEYYSYDVDCEGSVDKPDYLAISEWLNLRDWLNKFPEGILSYVADTFSIWKLINYVLPRLKVEILARNGKLVLRPDSGDPVDIVCGLYHTRFATKKDADDYYKAWPASKINKYHVGNERTFEPTNEDKGVIELLWDIFGGDESKEGYKRLDSHIGCIYGDAINLERQVAIYSRLADKGFASTNIVLGIGSFTYVYITRDTGGYAAKGSWFEVEEQGVRSQYNIYKDPITDDGTKTSLKGFQYVTNVSGEYVNESEVSEDKTFSNGNLLKVIYEDGKFFNQTTLETIRERVKESL